MRRTADFISGMDILALLVKQCLAHRVAVHRLGQGVPSAKVFPSACEAHDLDFGSLPEVLKQCSISTILVFVNQLVGSLLGSSCFTGTSIRPNLLNIP